MIFKFDEVKEIKDRISRSGKRFDCWIARGVRKGFQDAPDEPYEKMVFPTDTITVIEQGITRPGCSLLQFLQKACKPGDSLTIINERDGKYWRWASIQKYTGGHSGPLPTYEPLKASPSEANDSTDEYIPSWGND